MHRRRSQVRSKAPSAALWLVLLLHLVLQPLGWGRPGDASTSFGRASCCCDAPGAANVALASEPPGTEAGEGACCSAALPAELAPSLPRAHAPTQDEDRCDCLAAPDRGPVAPEPQGPAAAPTAPLPPRAVQALRVLWTPPAGLPLARARRSDAAPPGAGPPLGLLHERFLL